MLAAFSSLQVGVEGMEKGKVFMTRDQAEITHVTNVWGACLQLGTVPPGVTEPLCPRFMSVFTLFLCAVGAPA